MNEQLNVAYSVDGEMFDMTSIDEVLDCLLSEYSELEFIIGKTYWKAESIKIKPTDVFDFDDLKDIVFDRMYDLVGDCADSVGISNMNTFDEFITKFLTENSNINSFYRVINPVEMKVTVEDIA